MSAISVVITESTQEIVANTPQWLTITTSVPSIVFYTLDGTDPTLDSNIYVDKLNLPTDKNPLIVKIWATNGSDQSIIVTETYESTLVGARLSRAKDTNNQAGYPIDYFPFGNPNAFVPHVYGEQVGTITNAADSTPILDGYDGSGNEVGSLDKPAIDYSFIYSTTNAIGETGRGIGTLPAEVIVYKRPAAPETSSTNDKFFNPKAKVIYKSSEDTANSDLNLMNRGSFSLPSSDRTSPVNYYYTAFEGNQNYGSAAVPQWNPTNKTLNYYYRDARSNRWIIDKESYTPKELPPVDIYSGNQHVFKWYPFLWKRII